MNKIINIEIPVYNRDDVFNKCFLKGLKYLIPLKDYISLSILFKYDNSSIELGFSLSFKYKFELNK